MLKMSTGCLGLDRLLKGGLNLDLYRATSICCVGDHDVGAVALGILLCSEVVLTHQGQGVWHGRREVASEIVAMWPKLPIRDISERMGRRTPCGPCLFLSLEPDRSPDSVLSLCDAVHGPISGNVPLSFTGVDLSGFPTPSWLHVITSISKRPGISFYFGVEDEIRMASLSDCVIKLSLTGGSGGEIEIQKCRFQSVALGKTTFEVNAEDSAGCPIRIGPPAEVRFKAAAVLQMFEYDVALSFAGEDRPYVGRVAALLKQLGIRVFYDEFEAHTLWGRDLAESLDSIYSERSFFCVMFISSHYSAKNWPNHERKSALARMVRDRGEYILPVRFDDTDLPGIRDTISYVDGRRTSADELVQILLRRFETEGLR